MIDKTQEEVDKLHSCVHSLWEWLVSEKIQDTPPSHWSQDKAMTAVEVVVTAYIEG